MTKADYKINAASFRDPSGFIFYFKDELYRQVNKSYQENYDLMMTSGLYRELVDLKLLISHEEVQLNCLTPEGYKVIKPQFIEFISYPYEWCFSQLKSAALLTLKAQKIALTHQMSLKDASAFNIQFYRGQPILIDTLSFEKYEAGRPWLAYRQFCQHFLGPLSLMAYKDIRLNQLFRIYIDGLPLDLVSRLLPIKSKLRLSLLTHIHFHAKSQKHFSDKPVSLTQHKMSRTALLALIDNLENAIMNIKWKGAETEWADYYQFTNYSEQSFEDKKRFVLEYLRRISPKTVWDLGANTGEFSFLASELGIKTVAFDYDITAVEKCYQIAIKRSERNILPLVLDLTNPSSGIGWENKERLSLVERGPADLVMVLALVHHLAISNNLPFNKIANFFSQLGRYLIIEFIPKDDSQVKKLLSTRKDIFNNYDQAEFEKEFLKYYKIISNNQIKDSNRNLYLMMHQ